MRNDDYNYVKKNREYLDRYYSDHQKKKNLTSLMSKSVRVLRTFGIFGFIHKMLYSLLKKKKSHYQSQINEENEKSTYDITKDKKIAVYTSVMGEYDAITQPVYISPFCDYFIFTDSDLPKDSIWKRREFQKDDNFEELNNYQKAKFFKVFPDKLFPEYKYSIWVDGNVEIHGDLSPFVSRLGNHFIGEFLHPNNDCIYDEALSIVGLGKANGKEVKRQIVAYKKQGFPANYGLCENSIIVREHNNPSCIKIMNIWWNELKEYTWRDQLSLTFSLWKLGLGFDVIAILGPCWRWNPRFRQHNHLEEK